MRMPTSLRQLIPQPRTAIRELGNQAAGLVVQVVATKYVANIYARWGIYTVAAAMGLWYPMTRAVLSVTKLDQKINEL